MTPSKKYTKLLHAIWVIFTVHSFVIASYFFYGMALTSGYPILFGRVSQLCFTIGMSVLIFSPIYFAWVFKHRHAIGITICSLLTCFIPIFWPVWLFWAFLPITRK